MELPQFLLDAWRLKHGAESRARDTDQLKGWTASALAHAHLSQQLDEYHRQPESSQAACSTLSDIAVGKILEVHYHQHPQHDPKSNAEHLMF